MTFTFRSSQSRNLSLAVVGQWTNGQNLTHGFLRDASGNITSFSVPVLNFGTAPNEINDSGQITGFYLDTSGALHGFVQ